MSLSGRYFGSGRHGGGAEKSLHGGSFEENPLWLVVLSDLMTNLMLFFLVLYAFTRQPENERAEAMAKLSGSFKGEQTESAKEQRAEAAVQKLQEQAAADAIKELVDPEKADVLLTEKQVRVRLTNPVLFKSGSAELSRGAERDLVPIAQMLQALPNEVIIEGHTDDVPIAAGPFRTNWELSAARAGCVRRYFSETLGLPAQRLIVAGYGEHKPLASNETREGRLKNRRIEIVVLRK